MAVDVERQTRESSASGPEQKETGETIWHEITKSSFAILGYTTPAGDPRSSGVVYKTRAGRMYVVVAADSWKAKHIAIAGRVSVVVPVHRGGPLALVAPIPPGTISFHAEATVRELNQSELGPLWDELAPLLPEGRAAHARLIELVPTGQFLVFGVHVPLMKMRDTPPIHVDVRSIAEGGADR